MGNTTRLSEALRTGGIFSDLEGNTKSDVLRAFVDRLPLPPEQDRAFLLGALEAREAMGSTGIGDGIAIPHVRKPIVLQIDRPFVTLGLLQHPIEFGSIDGKPVHALFMVVSPTVPAHLAILARLGFALRDDTLREMLRARAAPDDIIGRMEFIEHARTAGSHKGRTVGQ